MENNKTEPFHFPADWTVSHLNRELGVVTVKKNKSDPFHIPTDWTVSHLNRQLDVVTSKRQNSSVPHPNWLNRFPSEQRTRRCYIKKDKAHPSHIPTDWTVSHLNKDLDAVTSKKIHWFVLHPNRLNRFAFEQRVRRCCIEKGKNEPSHIATDWTVSHLTKELDVVTSKKTKLIRIHRNRLNRFPCEQRARRCYNEKDKTKPLHISTDWTVFYPSREIGEPFFPGTSYSFRGTHMDIKDELIL